METFRTGHSEIDAGHQEMVECANNIYAAIETKDVKGCQILFDAFIDVSEKHFRQEEAILRKAGFPRLPSHTEFHRQMLDRAENLRGLCHEITEKSDLRNCFEELIGFIIDDIIRGDTDFVSYLETRRNH